ncbi:MAG: amidohydrolase [Deltaproteobacteria bacterium]|nr:amidohydrolase [Deltaproteobacteria bacterium]
MLAPGFIDAHNHLMDYAMRLRYLDCRLPLTRDIHDLLQRIEVKAGETPAGKWIKGWGFADYKVKQRRFPTLKELDAIAPANPVGIDHISGHSAVVNSKGLEQLGISLKTPDPAGGKIERDPQTGEPNGVLHETAMLSLSFESIIREFEELGIEKQLAAVQSGTEKSASLGIPTACDAMSKPELLSIYQAAARGGDLKCRVVAMPYYDWSMSLLASGLRSGFGSDMFKLGPMKLLGDGSLSGRTAAVSIPYENTNDTGILYRNQETLDQIVRNLHEKGFQISIHAIGDRAVMQVLKAYEIIIGPKGPNPMRHRIEHAGILNQEIMQRIADMDVVVAVQPRMLYEQGDGFYRSCGEERIKMVYPYRALIESGIHVAGSSDWPVVSPDPILGMRDAIMRMTEEGRVLAPAQCLEPQQVLDMYTREAAYSLFEEDEKGTIEEGKLADMVILSADPLTTPPETWSDQLCVEKTIVGGEIVYEKSAFHH